MASDPGRVRGRTLVRALATALSCLTLTLDSATAQSRGPVFPPRRGGDAESLRRRLEPVLRLPEERLLALIPDRSGFLFVGCPNCNGGAQERQLAWTIDRPDEVACRYCGMRFPNEKYPENQVVRVKNPIGQMQEYPCWESPQPPPKTGRSARREGEPGEGYRYFFRARAWFEAREYFARAASDLALLYRLTGDRAHARRAALILDRFARVYPGYCVHYDLPFTQKRIFPGEQGHPFPVSDYRAAKWSWWAYMDIPEELIRAYDLVRASGEIDADMKRRIEDDFFRASVGFVRGFKPQYGNMDPTLLRGMIVAGRVLGEPDYVHEAVGRFRRIAEGQFFADGVWREGTTSYHRQTLGGLQRLAGLLRGYSDPPGYRHPRDGERYDDLDVVRDFPILQKAREVPGLLRYPDGRNVTVHDAWPGERGGPPTAETGPLLLPAYGHARLGRGRGDDQVQAHLHFSGGYGHQHADLLSVTLFARGQERLADLGYTHTRYRTWSIATLAHNTVMVDGRDQEKGSTDRPNDGSLNLYVPGDEILQVVEASAPRAYPGTARVYRRMLILVGVAPDRAYVVDLFRVEGGKRHEYILLGDADHDGTLETDLPRARAGDTLLPAGVRFTLPTGESVTGDAGGHNIAYAFVRDVAKGSPAGTWAARFTSDSTPRGAVRIHRLSEPGSEVFLGRAPSLRRARSDDALLDRYTSPILVERREGRDLSSTFVSVLEPYSDRPFLSAVERLPVAGGRPGDLALKVDWGGGTDFLLVAADAAGSTLRSGQMELQGRVGFVRERGGEAGLMRLVGGTRLAKGSSTLAGAGFVRGEVAGVLRKARGEGLDGLVVAGPLPAADVIEGRTVIVSDPAGFTMGHRVAGTAEHHGQPVLVLADDPAFEIDAEGRSRHSFFPGRTWTGKNRFEIATEAAAGSAPGGR
jgi:hypothetical protein